MVPDLSLRKLSILEEASVRGGLPPISPGGMTIPLKSWTHRLKRVARIPDSVDTELIGGISAAGHSSTMDSSQGDALDEIQIFREREKCKGAQERSNYGSTTKLGK
jgi:hypothetical protein